jgi:hypothetical protein
MTAQLAMALNDAPPEDTTLRGQLLRLPMEDRVWLDAMLMRGATLEAIDDDEADLRRIRAVRPQELLLTVETRARGLRRVWSRPRRDGDPAGWPRIDLAFIRYEPRLERELGARAEPTDNARAKRTHWRLQ